MAQIIRDAWGNGFRVHDAGGNEHFTLNTFTSGYTGSNGAKIIPDTFGNGYTVTQPNGSSEHFTPNMIGGGYTGNQGTRVQPNTLGGGYSTTTASSFSDADTAFGLIVIAALLVALPFIRIAWYVKQIKSTGNKLVRASLVMNGFCGTILCLPALVCSSIGFRQLKAVGNPHRGSAVCCIVASTLSLLFWIGLFAYFAGQTLKEVTFSELWLIFTETTPVSDPGTVIEQSLSAVLLVALACALITAVGLLIEKAVFAKKTNAASPSGKMAVIAYILGLVSLFGMYLFMTKPEISVADAFSTLASMGLGFIAVILGFIGLAKQRYKTVSLVAILSGAATWIWILAVEWASFA